MRRARRFSIFLHVLILVAPALGSLQVGAQEVAPEVTVLTPTTDVHRALDDVYSQPRFSRYRKAAAFPEPDRSRPTGSQQGSTGDSEASSPSDLPNPWEFNAGSVFQVIAYVLAGTIALGLLLALLYAATRRRPELATETSRAETPKAQVSRTQPGRPSDELLAGARANVLAQDFAGALSTLLYAAMRWVEQAELIRPRPGHTHWNYIRALRSAPARRRVFSEIAVAFDEVHFGLRAVNPEQIERLLVRFGEEFGDAPTP